MVLSQSSPKGGIRGTPYVSSTLSLQLACLDLCKVCRSFSFLHVTLWEDSPESLWVAPEDDHNNDNDDNDTTMGLQTPRERESGNTTPSRVPLVLPFSVSCRLSSHVLHRKRTTELRIRLERLRLELTLSAASGWNSSPVDLPQRLKQLVVVDQGVEGHGGLLPVALMSSVSSGGSSSLLKLHVDGNFVVPLADVVWPACLVQLSFGPRFHQRISEGDDVVKWPASLRQLSFKHWPNTESFAKIGWPASLECLVFFDQGFDQPIRGTAWPSSLRKLILGNRFNHPITGVVWPQSLHQLSFGICFNQDIAGVMWPASLQKLSFGINSAKPNEAEFVAGIGHCNSRRYSFNQPIAGAVLPPCVRQLSLGNAFNQPIVGVEWPSSLQELSLGFNFNQPVVGVVWPVSLQQLSFGYCFNQPIVGVGWPNSLERLKFGSNSDFHQPVTGVVWPNRLKILTLPRFYYHNLKGITWPASLEEISTGVHKYI